jgi:hypothetical protein
MTTAKGFCGAAHPDHGLCVRSLDHHQHAGGSILHLAPDGFQWLGWEDLDEVDFVSLVQQVDDIDHFEQVVKDALKGAKS